MIHGDMFPFPSCHIPRFGNKEDGVSSKSSVSPGMSGLMPNVGPLGTCERSELIGTEGKH